MSENRPKIGVGVYLVHEGKVLLFQRKTEHGDGTWGAAGGHLEHGEHWFECARREAMEELGVDIENPRIYGMTNDIFATGKHYVTIHIEAKVATPEFKNMEPEKHHNFTWFAWDEFPKNLFEPVTNMRAAGFKPSYIES